MLTVVESVTVFERHRSLLLGVAYRMLGSMWDAEDVVQDAYTRWARIEQDIRDPRAFLLTVVTRIALDHLKSAKVTREAYVGPWLPEPVATGALGPMDTAELRDSVAYATVHLMERMSPPERAVFVLREAFQLPYEQIAEIVGSSVANCRQLHSRGRPVWPAGGDCDRHRRPTRGYCARSCRRRRPATSPTSAACSATTSRSGTTAAARSGPRCDRSAASIGCCRSSPGCWNTASSAAARPWT